MKDNVVEGEVLPQVGRGGSGRRIHAWELVPSYYTNRDSFPLVPRVSWGKLAGTQIYIHHLDTLLSNKQRRRRRQPTLKQPIATMASNTDAEAKKE
eukprot:scaffold13933_cov262-Alexandrium_tamarense.AAC.2